MKKIMMIEDNEDHALLIRRALETSDCSVEHYVDGASALKVFQKIKNCEGRPDLILLDLQLPGMNGFEILQAVKKIDSLQHVPVVMLTTSARQQEIEKAYQLGAAGYLVKSEDFSVLISKLTSVKDYWLSVVESSYQSLTVRNR